MAASGMFMRLASSGLEGFLDTFQACPTVVSEENHGVVGVPRGLLGALGVLLAEEGTHRILPQARFRGGNRL